MWFRKEKKISISKEFKKDDAAKSVSEPGLTLEKETLQTSAKAPKKHSRMTPILPVNSIPYKKIDVIVYTMGKVGSSTISTSLKQAGLRCLDIHFMAPERILDGLTTYFANPDMDVLPTHIIESLVAHNMMKTPGRVKIVSLVRNPIMRNISAVFQNLPEHLHDNFDEILTRVQNYGARTPDHWFDRDFFKTTGIDIFSADVDPNADHFLFSNEKVDVLLLKLETPDERKEELLRDFVGREVKLERANEAKNKGYYDVYKKIVDDPNIVRNTFVSECLKLKYFKKLYSDKDAKRLRIRYSQSKA